MCFTLIHTMIAIAGFVVLEDNNLFDQSKCWYYRAPFNDRSINQIQVNYALFRGPKVTSSFTFKQALMVHLNPHFFYK